MCERRRQKKKERKKRTRPSVLLLPSKRVMRPGRSSWDKWPESSNSSSLPKADRKVGERLSPIPPSPSSPDVSLPPSSALSVSGAAETITLGMSDTVNDGLRWTEGDCLMDGSDDDDDGDDDEVGDDDEDGGDDDVGGGGGVVSGGREGGSMAVDDGALGAKLSIEPSSDE